MFSSASTPRAGASSRPPLDGQAPARYLFLMAYRDEATAARARVTALELELGERRTSRRTLFARRNAMRSELQRLSHALVWYSAGARYDFNPLTDGDDDSPTRPLARLPPDPVMAATIGPLDTRAALARAETLARALAATDPSLERLRAEVERLRDRCSQLRALVERYAATYPASPPPPEYRPPGKLALTVVGASLGGVAMVVLAVLLSLAA